MLNKPMKAVSPDGMIYYALYVDGEWKLYYKGYSAKSSKHKFEIISDKKIIESWEAATIISEYAKTIYENKDGTKLVQWVECKTIDTKDYIVYEVQRGGIRVSGTDLPTKYFTRDEMRKALQYTGDWK